MEDNRESIQISTNELREFFNSLIDRLEAEEPNKYFHIDENLYWDIHYSEKFRVSHEVKEIGVGSLFDEIELLKKYLNDVDDVNFHPTYLAYFASLLKYIAYERNTKGK